MATKWFCDRCGNEINGNFRVEISLTGPKDLCESCKQKVKEFIENKKKK